jgi:hypothetical protein
MREPPPWARSDHRTRITGAPSDDRITLPQGIFTGSPATRRRRSDHQTLNRITKRASTVVRGLSALLEEDSSDATRDALQEWLPPPAELLRIAELECAWRANGGGSAHPALLCARLHGERLGGWEATAEVAEGVLRIEQFNPWLRTEACRLLGCAHAALGQRAVACESAERAVAEAAKARYAWLEMVSLADLLRWSEASEAEGVRARECVRSRGGWRRWRASWSALWARVSCER